MKQTWLLFFAFIRSVFFLIFFFLRPFFSFVRSVLSFVFFNLILFFCSISPFCFLLHFSCIFLCSLDSLFSFPLPSLLFLFLRFIPSSSLFYSIPLSLPIFLFLSTFPQVHQRTLSFLIYAAFNWPNLGMKRKFPPPINLLISFENHSSSWPYLSATSSLPNVALRDVALNLGRDRFPWSRCQFFRRRLICCL